MPALLVRPRVLSCLYSFGRLRLGDRHPVVLEGDAGGIRSTTRAGVQRVDRGDLLAGELEVEDGKVLGDAGRLDRLRDRGAALLQMPAEHHLGDRLAVPAGDLQQRRVVERGPLATTI